VKEEALAHWGAVGQKQEESDVAVNIQRYGTLIV